MILSARLTARTARRTLAGAALAAASLAAWPQVAGTTTVGVAVAQLTQVAVGWSAKKQILGQTVYNENDEKICKVIDLIVTPDSAVSFAIVGAGGFVGLRRHEVAIPVEQFAPHDGGGFVLAGATKEIVKALPRFEYAKADAAH